MKKIVHEIKLTRVSFLITLIAITMFSKDMSSAFLGNISFEIGLFIVLSLFIIYGNIVYHMTRIGYLKRLYSHHFTGSSLFPSFTHSSPLVTFLVPSYKEEIQVIQQTLWSAALQNYSNKRIVLLLDNPPHPSSEKDRDLLEKSRNIAAEIQSRVDTILKKTELLVKVYEKNLSKTAKKSDIDTYKSFTTHLNSWLDDLETTLVSTDHIGEFYKDNVLGYWKKYISSESKKLFHEYKNNELHYKDLYQIYSKYSDIFSMEIETFERKIYENISHEPNKAMNINSYLALIGNKVRKFTVNNKKYIEVTKDPEVTETIPSSPYVITLDADSVLLPEYCSKLVHEMEKAENSQVAVIQTPYSAFPGSTSNVERIAGATTDIQYNIHQGFTYYNSTYWVGANAMLRTHALEDIKMYEMQGDKVSLKYIQDRTVIEDTESSIDLVSKGWRLYNFPERLAYSSTPPDFGSLIIQRARWANGGLIIFPKLVRYVVQKPFSFVRWQEFFIRANYLTSIAGVNIGTLILLVYPFGDNVFSWWLPIASIPYYTLYVRDLKLLGYKLSDIIRVYALNLLLIPINVAGVIKSIEQGITQRKIAFKRTPKIGNRVASELKFVAFQYILLSYIGFAIFFDIYNQNYTHLVYSLFNGSILLYGIYSFIGFVESWEDIRSQVSFPLVGKKIA